MLRILRRWLSEYKDLRVLVVPPIFRGTPEKFGDDIATALVICSVWDCVGFFVIFIS